ncbi:MAG: ribosomal protein S17 [Parcubacteria bacterium C7867-006]|nr:MAG: ribosomal protein S17 [Parcubacteria bacterium C7867-006]
MNKTMKKTEVSKSRKQLVGTVVSDKMKDTVVVEVSRFVKHPKYDKYLSKDKRFKADDKGNTKKVGDKVTIEECAPISKDKKFRVI